MALARVPKWKTCIELANAMFEHPEIWHKHGRRHSALGWLSPLEFETQNSIVAAYGSQAPDSARPGAPISLHQSWGGSHRSGVADDQPLQLFQPGPQHRQRRHHFAGPPVLSQTRLLTFPGWIARPTSTLVAPHAASP